MCNEWCQTLLGGSATERLWVWDWMNHLTPQCVVYPGARPEGLTKIACMTELLPERMCSGCLWLWLVVLRPSQLPKGNGGSSLLSPQNAFYSTSPPHPSSWPTAKSMHLTFCFHIFKICLSWALTVCLFCHILVTLSPFSMITLGCSKPPASQPIRACPAALALAFCAEVATYVHPWWGRKSGEKSRWVREKEGQRVNF